MTINNDSSQTTPDADVIPEHVWINPQAVMMANHKAGSALLLYRRVHTDRRVTTESPEAQQFTDEFLPNDVVECQILRDELKTARQLLDEVSNETAKTLEKTMRGHRLRMRVQRFLIGDKP